MSKFDSYFKPVKIITLITCLQTVLFILFFDFSKHNAALAPLNPFLEDPFDAVGSFAIQLSGAAALLALLRILRPYPRGITLKNLVIDPELRPDSPAGNSGHCNSGQCCPGSLLPKMA